MFSSPKILKPDVPPKRRSGAPGFLGRLFRLLPFSSAHHRLTARNSVTERPGAEQKPFRRNGA
jgi:hypothetical protein